MMLVPETVKGLAKQRGRWTSGGMEILRRHGNIFKSWKERRLFPIYLEQVLSILWSFCWLLMLIIILIHLFVDHTYIQMPYIYKCLFLSSICLIQFFVAMRLDKRYDPCLLRHSVTAIWYPFVYWYINALLVIRSVPTLFRRNRKLARWSSPDRGIGTTDDSVKKAAS
jgi:biofilm PGA synthesis N-glycosyltransferase PgaC